jgi:hypothetical protein
MRAGRAMVRRCRPMDIIRPHAPPRPQPYASTAKRHAFCPGGAFVEGEAFAAVLSCGARLLVEAGACGRMMSIGLHNRTIARRRAWAGCKRSSRRCKSAAHGSHAAGDRAAFLSAVRTSERSRRVARVRRAAPFLPICPVPPNWVSPKSSLRFENGPIPAMPCMDLTCPHPTCAFF